MRFTVRTMLTASAVTIALALSLTGCASLPRIIGAETATKMETASLKAAKTSLIVWRITQDAVLVYGRLPACDPAIPDAKVCRSAGAWDKIKSVELTTTAAILAARPLVEAGSDDIAFLAGVVTTVNNAQIAIAQAQKGN